MSNLAEPQTRWSSFEEKKRRIYVQIFMDVALTVMRMEGHNSHKMWAMSWRRKKKFFVVTVIKIFILTILISSPVLYDIKDSEKSTERRTQNTWHIMFYLLSKKERKTMCFSIQFLITISCSPLTKLRYV